jgi:hypothetical protein
VTRNAPYVRIARGTILIVCALVVVPAAVAARGGGGKVSCTQNSPGVAVQNNYQWGQWGSWGLPRQQLTYLIDVINYDVGCGSSTFTVNISAPGGFSVSPATSTVSLKSGASAYVWAYVTSPSAIADGDYPLTVSVSRTGTSTAASTGSFVSYYKVYSSDSVAPTLYWPNPGDGTTITGRSYNMAVSASDDHAVKTIDLYIDGAYKSETLCDDIAYTCSLNYSWATSSGAHTATFKATDWMGNVGVSTVGFTVG